MDRNFARALKLVLKHEGGWADHPSDPGGATMKGITIGTFRRFVNAKATKDDLRHITDKQVADIYRRQYWNAVSADELPDGVDYAVFDYAVNSGPGRAAKALQNIIGAQQDGKIGPATLGTVKLHNPAKLVNRLCDERLAFLKRLKTWKTFGKGWNSRVAGVRSEALIMCAAAPKNDGWVALPPYVPVQPVPSVPAPEVALEAQRPPVGKPERGGFLEWLIGRLWK